MATVPTTGFFTSYLVPILIGVIIFSSLTWGAYLIYRLLKRIGLFRMFTSSRLKRKFRNKTFNDDIVAFCREVIMRGWRYKDIEVFARGRATRDEILYTFMQVQRLMKDDKELSIVNADTPKDYYKILE